MLASTNTDDFQVFLRRKNQRNSYCYPVSLSKKRKQALPKKGVDLQESTVKTEWTFKQSVTKAEIIAILQFADQNTPFASADILGPCYREQFTDSRIAQNVVIRAKKMSYLVGYGLGPLFY